MGSAFSSNPSNTWLDLDNLDSPQKSLYLAKCAHELKNLFVSISRFINNNIDNPKTSKKTLLKDNELFHDEKETNLFLIHLCEFGMNIINDINIISSAQNNITTYKNNNKNNNNNNNTEFNICEALDFCLKIFQYRQKFEKPNIKVKSCYSVNSDKKIKSINEVRFKQVVINWLSNSYKFTQSGSITWSCYHVDDNSIRVKVTDTGLGFKESDIIHLFQPFSVIERNQGLNKNGSGLGLCIVKEIWESFNSKIDFRSDKQYGGSEFWFDLSDDIKEVNIIDPNEKISNTLRDIMYSINEDDDNTSCKQENLKSLKKIFPERLISLNEESNYNNNIKEHDNSHSKQKTETRMNTNIVSDIIENTSNYNSISPTWVTSAKVYQSPHWAKLPSNYQLKLNSQWSKYRPIHSWYGTDASLPNISQLKLQKITSKTNPNSLTVSKLENCEINCKIKKIIICDDDSNNGNAIKALIKKCYTNIGKAESTPEILYTENGIQCWYQAYMNWIKRTPVNWIIIDENMWFLNGNIVCSWIKDMKEMNDIKIFWMSGEVSTINETQADGLFNKPLYINDIMQILCS